MPTRLHAPLKSGVSTIVLAFALSSAPVLAGGLPGHGRYVAGHGAIDKSGGVLTVDQSSRTGIIDWKSFSIGRNSSVVVNNGGGATLNRVTGTNISRIAGALHATGSVYLVNSSGVFVTGTGRILTTGTFAASGANGGALGDRKRLFFTGGESGNVVNRGSIVSVNGGVSLHGRNVENSGFIAARNAALIAAHSMYLSGRINVHGSHGRGGNVETSGRSVHLHGATIAARNWLVDPTNLNVDANAATTINNSLGAGTNVTLKTKASGAKGPGVRSSGDGDISISAPISWSTGAKLTLDAYHGIDVDSSIAVRSTGILNLKTNDGGSLGVLAFLGGRVVFSKITAQLFINSVSYSIVKSLPSLIAKIAAHPNGHFALGAGYNAMGDGVYKAAPVATTFTGTFEGLGNTISKLRINSTKTSIGLFATLGSGSLVENLNLVNANVKGGSGAQSVGVLAGIGEGTIRNVIARGVVNAPQSNAAGGLVGSLNPGSIIDSHVRVTVTGNANAGGLVGDLESGKIRGSSATGNDTGGNGANAGGLVGIMNDGTISGSFATGNSFADGGGAWVGGLVGEMDGVSSVTDSHATGDAAGTGNNAGYAGLIGFTGARSHATITNSYATGNVNGGGSGTGNGGLIGYISGNSTNSITNSYATGNVVGGDSTHNGGLIGLILSGGTNTIARTFATGSVTGGNSASAGGLIGMNEGAVTDSYATGAVGAGTSSKVGGLVGWNRVQGSTSGSIATSYSTGAPTGGAGSTIGGLIGEDDATTEDHIVNAYWDTDTSGISDTTKGAGNVTSDPGITGLTDTQFKSGLPTGFSSSVWGSDGLDNNGYPFLLVFNPL